VQELASLRLEEMETLHIRRTLEMTRGRIEGRNGAAVLLGINPSTLRARMRKLRIPFGRRENHQPP
jgi:DNA-binding protein Fis